MTSIKLKNIPESNSFWKGIGGNFDNFTQIVNEFVDNSISNLMVNEELIEKNIIIYITEHKKNFYKVKIMDSGTGIENLDAAFTLGSTEGKKSSLNEHGFGMKHALAA